MLEVEEPFELNLNVTPACLPSRNAHPNKRCVVSGWGNTSPLVDIIGSANYASELQAASLSICERTDENGLLVSAMFQLKSPSHADSGGPLVCPTDGGATLQGLVHGGRNLWPLFSVSHYTDILPFVSEIEDVISRGNDHTCPINDLSYKDKKCDIHLNNQSNCFDGGDCCALEANPYPCMNECFDNAKTEEELEMCNNCMCKV